jgi:hypothetical protein
MTADRDKPAIAATTTAAGEATDDRGATTRTCSRCRAAFPADPTLLFTADDEWWLCPPCSEMLLGTNRLRGWRRAGAAGAT